MLATIAVLATFTVLATFAVSTMFAVYWFTGCDHIKQQHDRVVTILHAAEAFDFMFT